MTFRPDWHKSYSVELGNLNALKSGGRRFTRCSTPFQSTNHMHMLVEMGAVYG